MRLRPSLVTMALAAALAIPANAPAATYPPQTTLGYGKPPEISRPGYLDPITDPVFGTRVVRITKPLPGGAKRPIVRHVYSKIEPWNSDESLLLIGSVYPYLLLDGHTFQRLGRVSAPSEAVWANTQPSRVYGVSRDRFGFIDLAAADPDAFQPLVRFPRYAYVSLGFGEGNLSNDDRYAALIGVRSSGDRDLIVYDLLAGQTVAVRRLGRALDNATMAQSGEYVVVVWGRDGRGRKEGVEAFDRELRFQRQLTRGSAHGDVGYTSEGAEAWVSYSAERRRSIGAYPLAGGPPITVIDADPGTWGGHVSCRNLARPGWCYISDAGHTARYWRGYDQVWAQQIAPDGPVEVFAHEHHSFDAGYYHQPQAVPSRDGARVLWASDWDGGRRAPVFAYVAAAR
jgi:hypothetical protein